MQSNLQVGLKIVGLTLFACFLSFFVYISVFTVTKGFSTKVIGYDVYEVSEGKTGELVAHLDSKPENPDKNLRYVSVYSEMPKSAEIITGVIQIICGVGVYFCMAGTPIAAAAAKDRSRSDFEGVPYNKNRGLFIGLIAAVPAFLLYIAALIIKLAGVSGKAADMYYWTYTWVSLCPVKPLVNAIGADKLSTAPTVSVAVLGIIPVLVVLFCYVMYRICYNEDSVISKLLYKSTVKKDGGRRLGR